MKFKIVLYFLCAFVVFGAISFANEKMLTLNEIMDKVEKKYDVVDFSSYFIQESTMKA
ncbi:MAG: hypothetical protein HKO91_06270, partial [Desulfobacterales bacterium]|nr:hypothetical protein [Desulfobacterales bacterium]